MNDYFLRMFAYNEWASMQLIEVLEVNKVEDEKILRWISHISNAEYIWWDRLNGREARVAPFDPQSLDRTKRRILELHGEINLWLQELSPHTFSQEFTYTTTRAKVYTNTFQDVLAHLVNHGSHHRAQISARLRELGIAPPGIDFIFYVRR